MSKQVFEVIAQTSESQNTYNIKQSLDSILKSTAQRYGQNKRVVVVVEILEL